jgi:hypothetical protein
MNSEVENIMTELGCDARRARVIAERRETERGQDEASAVIRRERALYLLQEEKDRKDPRRCAERAEAEKEAEQQRIADAQRNHTARIAREESERKRLQDRAREEGKHRLPIAYPAAEPDKLHGDKVPCELCGGLVVPSVGHHRVAEGKGNFVSPTSALDYCVRNTEKAIRSGFLNQETAKLVSK